MKKILLTTALIMFCALPGSASAQSPLNLNSEQPLEITADESLEWKRNDLQFIARKNALAKQGNVSVAAETLTADYRDADKGMQIYNVIAENNVIIHSNESDAYGQKAVYNLDKGQATMTGHNLKLVSVDQVVTAKESFEYWVTDGKLVAIGSARVERKNTAGDTDTLEADKISAVMKDNGKGQRVLSEMEATGNVVITTPTEMVTGKHGIYRASSNKAELTGGVTIKRGPNILEGEKAEVDLTTNTSRMFGSPMGNSRVRGVFYPGSKKKTPQ